MGRLLFLLMLVAGTVGAPAEAPGGESPEADAPDGMLVMGVVGRAGSASAVHGERAVVADPRTGEVRARRLAGGTLCYSEVMAVGDRVLYHGHRGRRSVLLSLPLSLKGAPRAVSDERRGADGGLQPDLRRSEWLLAAGRSSFAWCDRRCRTLHVQSRTGERRFSPPRGTSLYIGHGALSPDGSRLAVPVTEGRGPRAAVLDLASGSWTMVQGGRLRGYEAMAWSPSGRWLYFTGRAQRLFAWRVGAASVTRLPVDTDGTVMSIATTS